MYKRVSGLLHAVLLLILIGTCGSTMYFINNEPSVGSAVPPTAIFRPTPVPSLSRTAETRAETGWSSLGPGLERRLIRIYNDQDQQVESVYIWRLDQKYFRMDVVYDERPRSLETWQKETDASLVLNGGYFSIANEIYFPDGLTIVNGKAFGRSFDGFGGMLAINKSRAELRWLVEKPYNVNISTIKTIFSNNKSPWFVS